MLKIVTWNIARRDEPWRVLAESDYDLAFLQEAAPPPPGLADRFEVDPAPWRTAGAGKDRRWRTAVVKLSERVQVEWLEPKALGDAQPGELGVSRLGTLAAARITPESGEPLLAASLYAPWERPHESTGSNWILSDSSAHRVVSDLSVLIGRQSGHRIVAAGDLNILHGYGEEGSLYWAARYATVFERMEALGLPFVGPQAPHGRQAEPWPKELPAASRNVPTFHTNRQDPQTATRQLDFVFASKGLSVRTQARNDPEDWGPSDHCRIEIEVEE